MPSLAFCLSLARQESACQQNHTGLIHAGENVYTCFRSSVPFETPLSPYTVQEADRWLKRCDIDLEIHT
jgi:hypothetical protein